MWLNSVHPYMAVGCTKIMYAFDLGALVPNRQAKISYVHDTADDQNNFGKRVGTHKYDQDRRVGILGNCDPDFYVELFMATTST